MKKTVVIASVKNECDIIEFFCRYNLTYSDALLIHENHKSSDNTRELIEELIGEGLPIFFEAEEDMYFEAAKRELTKIAVEKYNADIVIPLDADEFMCLADNKESIRDIYPGVGLSPIRYVLENLEDNIEYQVPWRTYVYEKEPAVPGQFSPGDFTCYRNPDLEEAQGHAGKAVASRYLLEEKQAYFETGSHWLVYPDENEETIKTEVSKELVCAHYPIRSKQQVMKKAILNFINKWTLPEQQRPTGKELAIYQLGILFNDIKQHGEISARIMKEVSITYSLFSYKADKEKVDELLRGLGEELLVEGVMDTSFCADKLSPRYTGVNENDRTFLQAQLDLLDKALNNIDSESRIKAQVVRDLTHQRDVLIQQRDGLTQERDLLKAHIEDMYQSKSWKIGSRIVGIYRFFVPIRD